MRSGKMVTRLDIYIFRQVLFALVVATGGLTALIWLTQSLRFVDLVVNRGLSFFVFIHLTGAADPQLRRGDPADHHLRRDPVRLSAHGDRPGADGDARRRPVALGAGPPGAGGGAAGDSGRLRPQHLWAVPAATSNFKEFQWEIRNRLAAFLLQDGRFHAAVRQAHGLCPLPRSGRHTARHSGGRRARSDRPCHHPGRARPSGGRSQRPAGRAAGRQPAGNRPPDRPAQHADVQAERDRPRRRHQGRCRPPDRHVGGPARRTARSAPVASNATAPKWMAEGHQAADRTPDHAVVRHGRRCSRHSAACFRRHGGIVRPLVTVGVMVGAAGAWAWRSARSPHATTACWS